MNRHFILFISILLFPTAAWRLFGAESEADIKREAREFLAMYNQLAQRLYTVASEADWKASTDVTDEHTGQRIGANEAKAAFQGSVYVIEKTKKLLEQKAALDDLTNRQLEAILLAAADYPGTIPETVSARVNAEAKQSAILDGFEFRSTNEAGVVQVVTPNQIEDVLVTSTNLAERKRIWEVSKQTGPALRAGLLELQRIRNRVAREMGYTSFFDLQVADYGMSVGEMRALTERLITELKPLYEQLHCWARHRLAERYQQPVPQMIPAHWLGNRWAQSWPGIVEGIDLDKLVEGKTPEWIVQQAERFYVSLGMPSLPKSFYEKSDLYELPPGAARKKNTHASAWHVDLDKDVRSVMSVKANFEWLQTTHHELGHIYYYLAYSNPEVPLTLRSGANRAFHEAIGDLIGIAAGQIPYLHAIGLVKQDVAIDRTQYLLNEALDQVVFIPWSAGVMTSWEHDFYEKELPANRLNQRWWEYVAKYQGIAPPAPRGEDYCDPATKTHINDDPAQYYDYALAFIIKYQLHMHIAKKILKQDPHNCNYYGNPEVGKFLDGILRLGKTRAWRQVLKEATGEEINARAMLEYFAPALEFLKKENQGRKVGW